MVKHQLGRYGLWQTNSFPGRRAEIIKLHLEVRLYPLGFHFHRALWTARWTVFFVIVLFRWDRPPTMQLWLSWNSSWRPGWPWIHRNPSASSFSVLELKSCDSTAWPSYDFYYCDNHMNKIILRRKGFISPYNLQICFPIFLKLQKYQLGWFITYLLTLLDL